MMKIDVVDNFIYLSDLNPISSKDIKLQISGYGFRLNNDGVYHLEHPEPMYILTSLFEFMEANDYDYELSDNASSSIQNNQRSNEELDSFKEDALRIKNGEIEEDDLSDFREFLNTLPRTLRDHQEKSAFHLYNTGNGANFSVPGAGKTTVVLSVYEKLRREGVVDTLFVLGPTACFYPDR